MKKLAFYKLMLSLRRNIPLFLLYIAGYLILSVIVVNYVTFWLALDYPDFLSIFQANDRSLFQDFLLQVIIENQQVYASMAADRKSVV